VQFSGPLSLVDALLADHAEAVVREGVSDAARHAGCTTLAVNVCNSGTSAVTGTPVTDDSLDNRDDSCAKNDADNRTARVVSGLFTRSARRVGVDGTRAGRR